MSPEFPRELGLMVHREVRRYSAAFLGFDEFHDHVGGPGAAGSGVFVQVGRHVVAAISGHQIQRGAHAERAQLFAFISEKPPFDAGWLAHDIVRCGGTGDTDEEWDLGWLRIEPRILRSLGRQALPVERIDSTFSPEPNRLLFLYGVSKDLVTTDLHADGKPRYTYAECGFMTQPLLTGPLGATARDGVDLFLEYPKESLQDDSPLAAPTPSAIGLSGSGVWAVNLRESPVWTPDRVRLVGIVRSSSKEGEWVRATRIEHWLAGLLPEWLDDTAATAGRHWSER